MKKLLSIFSIAIAASAVTSCVDPDPAAVYGYTNATSNFPGPRMLKAISYANNLQESYVQSGGKVSKMDAYTYNGSTQQDHTIYTVTYNGSQISEFKQVGTSTGNPTSMTTTYKPTYNAAGRISGFVADQYLGTALSTHKIADFTYDSSGRLKRIFEKTGIPGSTPGTYSYGSHWDLNLTYSGNNVITIFSVRNTVDPVTGAIFASNSMTYDYNNFDSKPSPYSTLPLDFRIMLASTADVYAERLSENNPATMKLSTPALPNAGTSTYTYQYDQQNYPIYDGIHNFTYQALQ